MDGAIIICVATTNGQSKVLSSGPFSPSNLSSGSMKTEEPVHSPCAVTSLNSPGSSPPPPLVPPLRIKREMGVKPEPVDSDSEPEFTIDMRARDVIEAARGLGCKMVGSCSVLGDRAPPPFPPDPPPQKLIREQLLPPTPSVYLENKKDAFSLQLQEFCLKHPIAVVRGMAAALKLGTLSTFACVPCCYIFYFQIWACFRRKLWLKPIQSMLSRCERKCSKLAMKTLIRRVAERGLAFRIAVIRLLLNTPSIKLLVFKTV